MSTVLCIVGLDDKAEISFCDDVNEVKERKKEIRTHY